MVDMGHMIDKAQKHDSKGRGSMGLRYHLELGLAARLLRDLDCAVLSAHYYRRDAIASDKHDT